MVSALDRLKNLTNKISSYETARKNNMLILEKLFYEIGIDKKIDNFVDIFDFKAVNLSGVSLLKDSMGKIKEGKYLQILAIKYNKEAKVKSKNISLAYFGRVESVDEDFKNKVAEFVIRYRFEKSFMTLEHYNEMLDYFKVNDE